MCLFCHILLDFDHRFQILSNEKKKQVKNRVSSKEFVFAISVFRNRLDEASNYRPTRLPKGARKGVGIDNSAESKLEKKCVP